MNSLSANRKIYFDIGDILEYAKHSRFVSGIQRVSIHVMMGIIENNPNEKFGFVALDNGRYVELPQALLDSLSEFDLLKLLSLLRMRKRHRLSLDQIREKYKFRPFRLAYHRCRYHLRVSKINIRAGREVELKKGDYLVFLGIARDINSSPCIFRTMKQRQVSIVSMVYDLIPILFPQYFGQPVAQNFRKWLDQIYVVSDRIVAISENTAKDILEDMNRRSHRKVDVIVTPLAHEFVYRGGTPVAPDRLTKPLDRPFVLCVGTIEIRKNGVGLLRAWRRIIDDLGNSTPNLVFAGRKGWLIDEFEKIIQEDRELSAHIHIIDNASDAELVLLYRKCEFTVFPSFYEGWGLPIGEALWFEKTCVASESSSMPEVGMDMCVYVNPHDTYDIYTNVKRLITDKRYRLSLESRIDRGQLRTWSQVADSVYRAIVHV